MKLNPMSPKLAATAILLATTGATLIVTPAQAAEETTPAPITSTINKYDLETFNSSTFKEPNTVSWAVAYESKPTESAPAETALLTQQTELAKTQKSIVEKKAAVVRAEQERIAAEQAAVAKAEADRLAAEKVAAEKAEADRLAAERAAAEQAVEAQRVAAEKAVEAERAASIQVALAAQATAHPETTSSTTTYSPSSVSVQSAPASTPATSSVGAALVSSAYSQLGVHQDCTAMVEKALRSAGKSVGDLAPTDFYRYGTVVTTPQPGDLMIQPGHVAIFVGNGMAISGGFDGYDTVLHPASYLKGAVFVRVS